MLGEFRSLKKSIEKIRSRRDPDAQPEPPCRCGCVRVVLVLAKCAEPRVPHLAFAVFEKYLVGGMYQAIYRTTDMKLLPCPSHGHARCWSLHPAPVSIHEALRILDVVRHGRVQLLHLVSHAEVGEHVARHELRRARPAHACIRYTISPAWAMA